MTDINVEEARNSLAATQIIHSIIAQQKMFEALENKTSVTLNLAEVAALLLSINDLSKGVLENA